MEDENTELRIILEHYFNDTNFTECLLADTCTDQLVEAGSELGPDSWVLAALVAVYSLVLVAGLLGNTLVIYCVWRYPGLHTTTNTYILNLALADEAFLLGLPLLIATMVAGGWPFPSWLCPAYMVTTSINQITSTLFLTVLAADRYVAVCHPITAPSLRTPAICRVVTACTWLLSGAMMVPVMLFSSTVTSPLTSTTTCTILWPMETGDSVFNSQTIFTLYSFILGFAGPSLLMLVFYGLVMVQLWCCGPGTAVKTRSPSQQRLQRRVTRLILTVITVYLLCWTPHWATQLLLVFAPPGSVSQQSLVTAALASTCLQYSNSAINPVLYTFLSDHFRRSFLDTCWCRGAGPSRHHRDLTFTTRRTRRGPVYTAVMQDDTSGRHGSGATTHVTSVSRSVCPSSPRPGPVMAVVRGHLAPPAPACR